MSSEIQKAVAGEMSLVRNKSRDHLVDMQFIRKYVLSTAEEQNLFIFFTRVHMLPKQMSKEVNN